MHLSDRLFQWSDPLYTAAETYWKDARTQRRVANLLVWAFVANLLVIEANRRGWLPEPFAQLVPTNHFHAGRQRLLGAARLRDPRSGLRAAPVDLGLGGQAARNPFHHPVARLVPGVHPLRRSPALGRDLRLVAAHRGGYVRRLATFVAIGLFYRFQRHQPITRSKEAQDRFRATKRLLALVLLGTFVSIGAQDAWGYLRYETPAISSTPSSRSWCSATFCLSSFRCATPRATRWFFATPASPW